MDDNVYISKEDFENLILKEEPLEGFEIHTIEDLERLNSGVHYYRMILLRKSDFKFFGFKYFYGLVNTGSSTDIVYLMDGKSDPETGLYKLGKYKQRTETIVIYDEVEE